MCEAPTRVAICVPTCRRPAGLTRLLGALAGLRFQGLPPSLRLVVVDNDPAASGRAVCDALAERLPMPLDYRVEKRRGIPQARNAALAACLADSDFVAFLDDDEVPSEIWLDELLRVQRQTAADAVTGPCLSRFREPPPAWVEASEIFLRPRPDNGESVGFAFTGNVLLRTRAVAGMDSLFDERLASIGGEDSEFFERFTRAGHRIAWCDSAVVEDEVPAACVRLSWILGRAYRSGAATAYIDRKLDPELATLLRVLAHGAWCLGRASLALLLASLRGRAAAARALRLGAFGAGRLGGLVGLHYAEYRVIRGG